MLTQGINFKNFKLKSSNLKIKKELFSILNNKNEVLLSLGENYKINFNLHKYKNFKNIRIIGMGGSTLGTQAIYDFLNHKIKKKLYFIDNIQAYKKKERKKKFLNLIVSKSGNTIETIVNSNILIKKQDKNIFITENKKNYLHEFHNGLN